MKPELFSEDDWDDMAAWGSEDTTGRNYDFAADLEHAVFEVRQWLTAHKVYRQVLAEDEKILAFFDKVDGMNALSQKRFWNNCKPRYREQLKEDVTGGPPQFRALYRSKTPKKNTYKHKLALSVADVFSKHGRPVKLTEGSALQSVIVILLRYLPAGVSAKKVAEEVPPLVRRNLRALEKILYPI